MLHLQTDDLYYNKDTRCFIAEASDLQLSVGNWNAGMKIPIETSAVVLNPKTNKSRLFMFMHPDVDNEEVVGWVYKCDISDLKLIIIND